MHRVHKPVHLHNGSACELAGRCTCTVLHEAAVLLLESRISLPLVYLGPSG